MSKTAESVGFEPGTQGHTLGPHPTQKGYSGAEYWQCSCGFQVYARYKQNGKIGKTASRYWRQHLDAQTLPDDEIIPIGKSTRPRIIWEYYVFSRTYAGVDEFAHRTRFRNWAKAGSTGGWMDMHHWAVGVRRISKSKGTTLGNSVLLIARTKEEAVAKARKNLTRDQDDGHNVEWTLTDTMPLPINPQSSFATLLTRLETAVEDGNLVDVEAMEAEVTQILSLVPVLELGVQRLAQRKQEVVAGMLNQHSTSQPVVGEIFDADAPL